MFVGNFVPNYPGLETLDGDLISIEDSKFLLA